ncbi:hypothetical protein OfM2_05080 [Lactovum odontotermitis]
MNEQQTKDRQIVFLKAHEQEMTDYIKTQSDKVSSVSYSWKKMSVETIGNGLPQGGGDIFKLRITIFDKNHEEINAFGFAVEPDNVEDPILIKRMYTINADYTYFKGV